MILNNKIKNIILVVGFIILILYELRMMLHILKIKKNKKI